MALRLMRTFLRESHHQLVRLISRRISSVKRVMRAVDSEHHQIYNSSNSPILFILKNKQQRYSVLHYTMWDSSHVSHESCHMTSSVLIYASNRQAVHAASRSRPQTTRPNTHRHSASKLDNLPQLLQRRPNTPVINHTQPRTTRFHTAATTRRQPRTRRESPCPYRHHRPRVQPPARP